MELLVATSNAGKAREFRQMLGEERFSWLDPGAVGLPPVEETGRTFRANACLKATAYARYAGKWALADDSGLEVAELANAPGVQSARWAAFHVAGEGDAANNEWLLKQLESVPDERRSARFVCVLALADPRGGIVVSSYGEVNGRILRSARGSSGFGYDPLFFVEALGKTTAELLPEEKHRLSHRGAALRRLRSVIDDLKLG